MDKHMEKLRAAAARWRDSLKEIGVLLNAITEEAKREAARMMLREEFGINKVATGIAMRWAAGELGTDNQAGVAIGKIPWSVLEKMPTATVLDAVTAKHEVWNPATGQCESKPLEKMTRCEVNNNISRLGFRKAVDRRSTKVSRFEAIDGHEENGWAVVRVGGTPPFEVRIGRPLLTTLWNALCNGGAAAVEVDAKPTKKARKTG
jgi:hypothetical protein